MLVIAVCDHFCYQAKFARVSNTGHAILQVLNEASKLAATNFANHVSTNIFNRTRRWLAFEVCSWQDPYIMALPAKKLQSWLTLLLRAATVAAQHSAITQLLPRFTSLEQPPQHVLSRLQGLVDTTRQHIGPTPVTTQAVATRPEKYLPWLYKVLSDFTAAQPRLQQRQAHAQQRLALVQLQHWQQELRHVQKQLHHAKLFPLLPQKGNSQQFIMITTASLHR